MGIRVQAAMAYNDRLMTAVEQGKPIPPPPHPAQPKGRFAGGSDNMGSLYAEMWLLYTALTGHRLLPQFVELFEILLRQEEECFGRGEPVTGTASHGQLDLAAFAMVLWLYYEQDRSRLPPEPNDLLLEQWRMRYLLWDLCSDGEGVWMPGARARKGGRVKNPPPGEPRPGDLIGGNRARDLALKIIRGEQVKIAKGDAYLVGVRALQALPASVLEEIRKPPARFFPMLEGFHVLRWTGLNGEPLEHICWMDEPYSHLRPRDKAAATAGSSVAHGRWIAEHLPWDLEVGPVPLTESLRETPPNRSLDVPRVDLPQKTKKQR